MARLERECKLVDETDAFGTGSVVGDLPNDGRWIQTASEVDRDARDLRTDVSESMSQSMFAPA